MLYNQIIQLELGLLELIILFNEPLFYVVLINFRCLSAITLATKCMTPAFRMHVKAHGTVAKIFRALQDATKDQVTFFFTNLVTYIMLNYCLEFRDVYSYSHVCFKSRSFEYGFRS
jgi:hypothetical protein